MMDVLCSVAFFFELLFGFLLVLTIMVYYRTVNKHYKYWEDRGIPHPKPSFPFGNTKEVILGRKHVGELYDYFYKEFKDEPFFGVYDMSSPVFVVRDPELAKHILTRDFKHFQDRMNIDAIINPKVDYVAKHLFNMTGKDWKNMRVKLSPLFTAGKTRSLFTLVEKKGEQLLKCMKEHTKKDPVVDIQDVLVRFAMDSIATCGFGLETNTLENRDFEFYHYVLQIFTFTIYRHINRLFIRVFPKIKNVIGARIWPKDMTDFFTGMVREIIEYRKKNKVSRNDLMNTLIEHSQSKHLDVQLKSPTNKNDPKDTAGLTLEEIVAEAFMFLAAGHETSSSTISFCLYELAQNPDIQERLYEEIQETLTKHGGNLTYQALQEMAYLDKVINESSRRHVLLPNLTRVCTETYNVPGSDLVIEKGMLVVIPVFAMHHDPQFYEESFKFDPERFSPQRVRERHSYVHLPFGEGPRMCIGTRLGLQQVKIGLFYMINNFKFNISPKSEIPYVLNNLAFSTQTDKPIYLHVSQRICSAQQ